MVGGAGWPLVVAGGIIDSQIENQSVSDDSGGEMRSTGGDLWWQGEASHVAITTTAGVKMESANNSACESSESASLPLLR